MTGNQARRTELLLIIVAGLVTSGAYVLAALGRTSTVPANLVPFLALVLGLLLAAHVGTRLLAPRADPVLLPLAAFLNGIGYVFITRLNRHLAGLQATWTLVGIAAYLATLIVIRRPGELARAKWTFAILGLGLLCLPFVPHMGLLINGSRIWVRVGFVNFQPGEFAKILLAIFFAAYLVENRELLATATWHVGPLWLPEPRHLGPVVAAWLGSLGIMVFQKDLGSSLLFFTLFVTLIWIATERASYLAISGTLFGIGAFAAWKLRFGQVHDRVAIWLDPWSQAQGKGYQIVQSTFAFATGGVAGTGLGLGDPTRIPEVKNDFIFAGIAEELGLLGATAIVLAYVLMVGAGLRIAIRAERPFEKLLAAGLTTITGVQAFVILGGVMRVVPLTGVTLPFVSYGGSSLVANYVLLALLVRLSDTSEKRAAAHAAATAEATA